MNRTPRWLACLSLALSTLSAAPMLVYIGTYTQTTSRGIYSLRFDPADGSLSAPQLAGEGQNLTFLAFDPSRTHLYAAGELRLDTKATPAPGGVTAFAVDAATGTLKFLNQQPTSGGATTHLAVDATGRMVVAVNYGAAYVCALPIQADGSLGERSAFISHNGRAPLGPNADRQKQAHAHSVTLSPDNRFAFVCDLGLDRVFGYRLNPENATLEINDPAEAAVPPGSGARHSKFSPDGRFFYVANEMGGSVSTFAYDAAHGALLLRQTASTLPEDFAGVSTVAEVRIHPNGKFLYVSNRGHDSIAVFARDSVLGTLTRVEIVPCGGKHPRNFALSPDGRWLLCANRDTDNLVVFRVDPATGRLTPNGNEAKIGMPVCVLFDH